MLKVISRQVKAAVIACSATLFLTSVTAFSDSYDLGPLWWLYTTKTSSTDANCKMDIYWNSSTGDQTINGKPYKYFRMYGYNNTNVNTDIYYTIESWSTYSGADPVCYYGDGINYSYLSDDEGGSGELKAVIHFLPGVYQTAELYFQHYSSSDLNEYKITPTMYTNDPGWTGCYYLEVYPDGTRQKVWH